MNNLLESAEIIEMAVDSGPEGQLWLYLETFCTGKVQARTQEELLLGRPWTDGGRTYFRSPDFMRYLDTNRFKEFKERGIYTILRRKGAKHHKFMLKGRCIACWSIEEFSLQNEGFIVPDVSKEEF
jgi:hypothetical protein